MNVGNSVRKALDDWAGDEMDAAMLHACNAIDGTAAKAYLQEKLGSNARFTRLLRENYDILGPMGAPGVNLHDTRFPVKVERPKATGGPDLADVIYAIHRCSHGHGQELPHGFDLLRNVADDRAGSPKVTRLRIERGKVQLSERILFGLLAVAVFSPMNGDQVIPNEYYLTFADIVLPIHE